MTSPSNIIPLVAAIHNDPAAFAEVYRLYVKRIYRYIYRRVGNAHDAEDLTT
jgi:DNA-directed RNA polymerase specialized sigma24 family protein